jgi:hypothetical protein
MKKNLLIYMKFKLSFNLVCLNCLKYDSLKIYNKHCYFLFISFYSINIFLKGFLNVFFKIKSKRLFNILLNNLCLSTRTLNVLIENILILIYNSKNTTYVRESLTILIINLPFISCRKVSIHIN